MQGLTLHRNAWHRTFYRATYDTYPNQNFCDYFWSLVFAFITLPFTWFTYAVQLILSLIPKTLKKDKYKDEFVKDEWREGGGYTQSVHDGYEEIPLTFSEKYFKLNGGWWFKFIPGVVGQALTFGAIYGFLHDPIGGLEVTGLILAVVFALVGIGFAMVSFANSKLSKSIVSNTQEGAKVLSEGFLSFKNKYCPKIEWLDEPIETSPENQPS